MRSQYVYPEIGRAGLGNELFPLMRSYDIAFESQAKMLWPNWYKIRVGPYVRRERDKRNYWRFMSSGGLAGQCTSFATRLLRGRRVDRQAGMANHFRSLPNDPGWYLEALNSFVKPRRRARWSDDDRWYVGVHVRLGDFAPAPADFSSLQENNTSTPMSWYLDVIRWVNSYAPHVPVRVMSDGLDAELSELLAMPNVERHIGGDALNDICALARSIAIVGSRSTFTAWSAFLGQVPLLVPPGGNAYLDERSCVFEGNDAKLYETWWRSALHRTNQTLSDKSYEDARYIGSLRTHNEDFPREGG